MKEKTGRGWAAWVRVLDRAGAVEWSHRDIARHVEAEHGLPHWWAQMVTLGYERIRGLRAKGQQRDGGFEVWRTRTLDVPVARLYRAFRNQRSRARWLDLDVEIRNATPDESIRIDWPDRTRVTAYFVAKGDAKSQVSVQHEKLADAKAAARAKAFWVERLSALKQALT